MMTFQATGPTPYRKQRSIWAYIVEDVGPTVLVLVTILVVAWSVVAAFTDPWAGFTIWETGQVATISEGGPAEGRLSLNDVVISVNGRPFDGNDKVFYQKAIGDTLTLQVRDEDGRVREEVFQILNATPDVIGGRLSLPFIASVFALTGAFVQALTRMSARSGMVGRLFLAFNSLIAIFLATTTLAEFNPSGLPLYYISGYLLVVVAVHFHTVFPKPVAAYGFVRVVVRVMS